LSGHDSSFAPLIENLDVIAGRRMLRQLEENEMNEPTYETRFALALATVRRSLLPIDLADMLADHEEALIDALRARDSVRAGAIALAAFDTYTVRLATQELQK
jgi:hypothetical protein